VQEQCGSEDCPPELADEIDEGKTLETATNAMIGVLAATAVLTVVLAAVTPWREGSRASTTSLLHPGGLILRW
jgi:hypothetical protein